jgi:hypothetical protein
MGDASNSTAAGDGVAPAAAEEPQRSWIVQHWRGELPLSDAFWFNGVVLNLVFDFLFWGWDNLAGDEPALPWAVAGLALLAFAVAVTPWQVVGVWRSVRRFPGRELPDGRHVGRWLWAITACVVSATWAVVALAVVAAVFDALR